MLRSGEDSTPTTAKHSTSDLSPRNPTCQEDAPSITKMSSASQGRYFQVTTTSIYRSRPLDDTIPTAHENEGQSASSVTLGSQIATTTPPRESGHATLHPSKVKSRETKRLRIKTKTNTSARIGGTDTRRRASRPKPFASRTCFAQRRTGSSTSWLDTCSPYRCGIRNTLHCTHSPRATTVDRSHRSTRPGSGTAATADRCKFRRLVLPPTRAGMQLLHHSGSSGSRVQHSQRIRQDRPRPRHRQPHTPAES